jgi:signal transduction histidine kinase
VAVATLGTAWCRRRPLPALIVIAAALAVPELFTRLTVTLWGHFAPLLVAVFALARWCDSRRGTAMGAAVALGAIAVLMLRVPSVGTADNIPFSLVPMLAAFVAGRTLRHRQLRNRELVAHASELEQTRAAHVAAAVADERARIARELHDIVAHCVSLVVIGEARALPPGVELTAYRVVQEALTNTLKHAGPGAKAHVEVRYLPRMLEVEIVDDGRAGSAAGTGHGLIGMTERASIYGGTLEAGVRTGGGFEVRVALPVDPA